MGTTFICTWHGQQFNDTGIYEAQGQTFVFTYLSTIHAPTLQGRMLVAAARRRPMLDQRRLPEPRLRA
jgi:hypothetical protein